MTTPPSERKSIDGLSIVDALADQWSLVVDFGRSTMWCERKEKEKKNKDSTRLDSTQFIGVGD